MGPSERCENQLTSGYAPPRVFAILLVLMTAGYAVAEGARRVETYLLRWRPEVSI